MEGIVSPKYRQVQNSLRRLILSGVYKEGDKIPSENDLCAQFGITRMTVRNALHTLENDGLILRQQGKGSIVQSKRKSIELLSIKGFTEVMKTKNISVETVIITKPHTTAWPADFLFELNDVEKAVDCIQLERLRKVEGEPVMFETTFIPNLNLRRLCKTEFINGSLFDTLHINHNVEIVNAKQKFRAIPATGKSEALLAVKKGQPLLHIMRKLGTNKENLNIYSSVFFNSENHLIEI